MSDALKTSTILLAYIGKRRASDGRLAHAFLKVNDNGTLFDPAIRCYKGKLPGYNVGTIVEFKCHADDDGSIFTKSGRITGVAADKELVSEWKGLHAAAVATEAIAKMAGDFDAWEALAPIRRAYHKTNPQGKAALLGALVYYVTRGRE